MTLTDPHGFLVRFNGGPLNGITTVISSDTWAWPLPARMGVLAHLDETPNVAMWDADGDGDGLPDELWRSPNAIVYAKLSESQLADGLHVVRGAEYVTGAS